MGGVKILPHYTYNDYLHWEGKWEIIEGTPYAMSPTPVPNHQRVSAKLSAEFINQLRQCQKYQVYQPIDYIADDIILQPDLLIVCGEIKKKFLDYFFLQLFKEQAYQVRLIPVTRNKILFDSRS